MLVCTQNLVSLQPTNLQNITDLGEGHTCLEYGKKLQQKDEAWEAKENCDLKM